MKRKDCMVERVSNFGVGVVFLSMALGLTLIGVTVLPIIGLLVAVPTFLLAGWFLAAPKSAECTI
jgi:uncharacterized membrane protein